MTSRGPASPFEKRIGFQDIVRGQRARQRGTLKELRTVVFRMQMTTLSWAYDNLARRKSRTSIQNFTLPFRQNYRAVVRKRLEAAAHQGHLDVQKETGAKAQPFRVPDRNRARERADVLAADHLGQLTVNLQKAWSQAMVGNIDPVQIRYVTKKVFADFAGWEQPEAL